MSKIHDDVLGELTEDKQDKDAFVGSISHAGTQISLRVEADGYPFPACLNLARAAVSSLRVVEERAKEAAVKELLDVYNESWREYIQADGEGGWIEVSNSKIDAAEFKSKITLQSVLIMGEELCTLFINDDGMFDGHCIGATSFNGVELSDFRATLFG